MKKTIKQIKPGYKVKLETTRPKVHLIIYHFEFPDRAPLMCIEIANDHESLLMNIEKVTPHRIIGYNYDFGTKLTYSFEVSDIIIPNDITEHLEKLEVA